MQRDKKKALLRARGFKAAKTDVDYKLFGPADFKLWREKYGWNSKESDAVETVYRKRSFRNGLKKLHRKHRGLVRAHIQEKHPRLSKRANRLVTTARKRASFLGIPFDITAGWVLEKLLAGRCEVTGISFDFGYDRLGNEDGWYRSMFAPSLDQRKARGGYTKENVQVVVWCYNAAKGEGSDADVMKMALALVERSKNTVYQG